MLTTGTCRNMEYDISELYNLNESNQGSKLLICMIGLSGCGKTCVTWKAPEN